MSGNSNIDELQKSLVDILGKKFNIIINDDGNVTIQTNLFVKDNVVEYVEPEEKAYSYQKLSFHFDDAGNLISSKSLVRANS